MVSVDVELLETFRNILALPNRICTHPTGRLGISAYRVQFGDRLFYDWLTVIGFTPRKTYTIGQLEIPNGFFRDFLRGHLDGDGSIIAYVDRYNTRLKSKYVYQRLYVRFLTASKPHIEWLQVKVTELLGVDGYITMRPGDYRKVPMYSLHFAKKDAIKLLRWIYYAPDLPCLARKRVIAEPFLTGELRQFRHPPGFEVCERESDAATSDPLVSPERKSRP